MDHVIETPVVDNLAAVQVVASDSSDRPPPSDMSPTHLSRAQGCWRRLRLAAEHKAPTSSSAEVGTVTHKVLELAARMRLQGLVDRSKKADLRELRKILDELLAQGLCQAQDYEEVIVCLASMSPYDLSCVHAVEVPFSLTLDEKHSRLGGKIDRVDMIRSPGGQLRKIVVRDYKTGAAKLKAELRLDPQTLVYLIVARVEWPDDSIPLVIQYDYLSTGETVTVEWSPELDAWGRTYLRRMVDLYFSGANRANPGKQCGRCDYSPHCEEGGAWLKKQQNRVKAMGRWNDLDAVAAEYKEIAEAVRGLRSYSGLLQRHLWAQIDARTGKLDTGKWIVQRRTRRKITYMASGIPHVWRTLQHALAAQGKCDPNMTLEAMVKIVCRVVPARILAVVDGCEEARATLEDFSGLDRSEWLEVKRKEPCA